jgi:septum formation protein
VIGPDCPLILGSASPRRRAILAELGLAIRIVPGDTAEELRAGDTPAAYLERVVDEKLAAVAGRLDSGVRFAGILVADTTVVIDGEILGKPADHAEAARLVSRLVGRTHTVFTRYAISNALAPTEARVTRTVETFVTMRPATPDEVERYATTGEGLDKAGAYAAQGIGTFLIERIEGSYSNVVGLPACEVIQDLGRAGILERYP